jgi:hypothetical protein
MTMFRQEHAPTAKAAEDSRTPRPRGQSSVRFVATASWSVPMHRDPLPLCLRSSAVAIFPLAGSWIQSAKLFGKFVPLGRGEGDLAK